MTWPPILALGYVSDRSFKVILIPQPTNASAIRPPVVTLCVELLLEATGRPRFQVGPDLLRTCIRCGNNNMGVIRSTIDRMKVPAPVAACLGDLSFNSVSLWAV